MTTPVAVRVWEGQIRTVWNAWRTSVALSMTQPFIFLAGMGFGVGALVDAGDGAQSSLGGLSYVQFLAPALLATTAMMAGAFEAMWPVHDGFYWRRTFEAVAATPVSPRAVVNGLMLWWTTRVVVGVGGVAIALVVMPSTRSWGIIPAVVVSVLCGLGFAAPIASWTATRTSDTPFAALQRFVITPLFLFGGAFYPLTALPGAIRPVAWVTPLWHGVELCRSFTVGNSSPYGVYVHLGVLLAWCVAGYLACLVTFDRRIRR